MASHAMDSDRGDTIAQVDGPDQRQIGAKQSESANAPIPVAILIFPASSASVIFGLYDLLLSVGRDWPLIVGGSPGPQAIRPLLVAAEPGPLMVCNGIPVPVNYPLADCPPVAVVCVPEVNIPPSAPMTGLFDREIAWLIERYHAGATLAASCSGAMLLAEAGLLDGHDATTHWAYCATLRQRFPKVNVHGQRSLVCSGDGQRLVMAGGGTSWLDLALFLIARLVSVEAAMQVAKLNLIDWHQIGQQPYARLAQTRQVEDALIARCQVWIAEHYRSPAPVAAMAKLSGLSERSLNRRFKAATGLSPLEYVHTLRLEEAKQLLEAGDLPVETIARDVGYEDAGFFNRLFQRQVKLTPAQYRKRFRGLRLSLDGPARG
ncbi:helix-turn-helix domain-containing protein [Methylomonas sp. SURF-1]|uniref:Helix-turn-helix domain-containing protein n=1 Tax=Methylomonas aurea TaxID=2952224 RepID=A0ABT1UKP3_9GAMM|nr:helix-turn-helix domain-containing protein [Methylomonas sp. SURF-1]MCQ8182812.1 helix-turn-helix domain-containing protein [Methylomonas sp. SURF-1]